MGNQGYEIHYAQAMVYTNVGLNKLMHDYAERNNNKTEVSLLSTDLIAPEKTSIQREYDL